MRIVIFAAFLSTTAFATSPPAGVTLSHGQFAGEGCPVASTAKADLGDAGGTLLLKLPDFNAQLSGKRLLRTACNITIELTQPGGWQLMPVGFEGAVSSDLPVGVKSELSLSLHYQADAADVTARQEIGVGSQMPTTLKLAEHWSPCPSKPSTTLVLRLALIAKGAATTGTSTLVVASEGKVPLLWRRCR